MGEIADSIINGDFDCVTGEYIGEGSGYPRTFHKYRTKPKGKSNKVTVSKETSCITNMCKDRGFSQSEQIKLVAKFLYSKGYKQLPVLREQYKIIHSQLKNDFRKFLIEIKNHEQGKAKL